MTRLTIPGLILGLILLTQCTTVPRTPVLESMGGYKSAQQSLTVMTYNVQNLFDTKDDPDKDDETYLPIEAKNNRVKAKCQKARRDYWIQECLNTDWNERILSKKMQRLTDVLEHVRGGQGPDILILQEVENRDVLEQWRREYLADFGYKPAVLLEGKDERGIDIGLLTKLDVVGPLKLHDIEFTANENLKADQIHPTRGILEVTLKLPSGELLTVLGLHLPSQGAPTEMRRQALLFLNKVRDTLPEERMVVVGGDFNITTTEDATHHYMENILAPKWEISHIMGCNGCMGTTYYHTNREWSFFDILLFSKNMTSSGQGPWHVLPNSVRIENESMYQTNNWGNPARFSQFRKDGVSDHWPMVADITPAKKIVKSNQETVKK